MLRPFQLNIRQGFTDKLPLQDASASVVVCNNVLLIVPHEKFPASLREIHRVAKPGDRILLGEIPSVPQQDPVPPLKTRGELLSHLYRKRPPNVGRNAAPHGLGSNPGSSPLSSTPEPAISFWDPPGEFIAIAQSSGLELVRYWKHSFPEGRNNYLFRKPQ